MHYYQFNIGDYRKDTMHLTPMEHYIYRSLIDLYYLDEAPIPLETQWVTRRLCLGCEHLAGLQNVLSDFFVLTEKGYSHARIDAEIESYHKLAEKNRVNGAKGGRPKNQDVNADKKPTGFPVATQSKPHGKATKNHKPITINQETINQETIGKSKTTPPDSGDLSLSDLVADSVLIEDYKSVRKAKRAGKITKTVISALIRESQKAGIGIDDAIRVCVERGWVGFKADWFYPSRGKRQANNDAGNQFVQSVLGD